jgi:hypothetical protein
MEALSQRSLASAMTSSDSLRYQEHYKTDIPQSVKTPIKTAFTKHTYTNLSPFFNALSFLALLPKFLARTPFGSVGHNKTPL